MAPPRPVRASSPSGHARFMSHSRWPGENVHRDEVDGMTRFYHPDRIDYDMVVSSGHDGRRLWSTAGVEVVDPSSVLVEGGGPMDGDAFRVYAAAMA